VIFVAKFLEGINMQEKKESSVAFRVEEKAIGVKIKSLKKVANEDVYCLEAPEEYNFIANGIVVHNCADALRYACFTHYFNRPTTKIKPEDLDQWYAETRSSQPQLPRFFQDPEPFHY